MKSEPPASLRLGHYPTQVFRVDKLSNADAELWIKNDGLTHPLYGGNKVRKLELVLADAMQRGTRRLVTAGYGGSHHVLATAVFGRQLGMPVTAVLCPQPWTPHAEATLRASIAAGVEPVVVGSMAGIALGLARVRRRGDYVIAPGGTSTLGTLGYLHAVSELVAQIRAGELPEPDVIVAPLGSGGTVAGILAGVLRSGLAARVVGVNVATSAPVGRALAVGFARAATRADAGDAGFVRLARHLEVDGSARGPGYGHETEAGKSATQEAAAIGIALDPTYTAKTFARALFMVRSARAERGRRRIILYWHTLSSADLSPLLAGAPAELDPELSGLMARI